jgi:undecaprenyl-phosphate 4-deoxy-4-formamido-L-arabinose transferase
VPLQLFTLFSMLCSGGSLALVALLLYRRFVLNLDRETFGVFTLLAILFFLISVAMIGIGLIGEYIGRMYQLVQQRPRYVTKEILERHDD